ncbi:hypothetical protein I548_3469 [Mycobacterium intracellulare]|nr:hypothetical protein I548_3469 [Mycobacterium intracellulare]
MLDAVVDDDKAGIDDIPVLVPTEGELESAPCGRFIGDEPVAIDAPRLTRIDSSRGSRQSMLLVFVKRRTHERLRYHRGRVLPGNGSVRPPSMDAHAATL